MLKQRLKDIVSIAYDILGNKIANGSVIVHNEASLQLQFGMILKTLGQLYEYAPTDFLAVMLETPQSVTTCKSANGNARCDIEIILSDGNGNQCTAYIELKYLKNSSTAAITDERFSVWTDIENVENYIGSSQNIGFVIVYTDNVNHTIAKNTKFCIGNNANIPAGTHPYTKNRLVNIKNNYTSNWDTYNLNHYLLKIEI